MTDKQANEAAEAMFWTIAMYQKGYEAIKRENQDLNKYEVFKLTEIWWDGVMTMVGLQGQTPRNNDTRGLL